jgi:glycosyltransferase involved in cell wall biosynthesis
MMAAPRVSVIVPTRNSAATLRACLRSISVQTYPSIETIVVDRDSTDSTRQIASEAGARTLLAGPERSAQRNVGARAAGGRWLLFVDSDMVLGPEVVASCTAIGGDEVAVVVPETGAPGGFLARVRTLEKRCYQGNELVEGARFFPREPFLAMGGYDERLIAGEDWDLTDRWRASGRPVRRAIALLVHDSVALTIPGLLAKRFRYGRFYLPYLRKDRPAALRHLRPDRFVRGFDELLGDPLVAVGLIGLKVLEAVSFGVGLAVARLAGGHGGND